MPHFPIDGELLLLQPSLLLPLLATPSIVQYCIVIVTLMKSDLQTLFSKEAMYIANIILAINSTILG